MLRKVTNIAGWGAGFGVVGAAIGSGAGAAIGAGIGRAVYETQDLCPEVKRLADQDHCEYYKPAADHWARCDIAFRESSCSSKSFFDTAQQRYTDDSTSRGAMIGAIVGGSIGFITGISYGIFHGFNIQQPSSTITFTTSAPATVATTPVAPAAPSAVSAPTTAVLISNVRQATPVSSSRTSFFSRASQQPNPPGGISLAEVRARVSIS